MFILIISLDVEMPWRTILVCLHTQSIEFMNAHQHSYLFPLSLFLSLSLLLLPACLEWNWLICVRSRPLVCACVCGNGLVLCAILPINADWQLTVAGSIIHLGVPILILLRIRDNWCISHKKSMNEPIRAYDGCTVWGNEEYITLTLMSVWPVGNENVQSRDSWLTGSNYTHTNTGQHKMRNEMHGKTTHIANIDACQPLICAIGLRMHAYEMPLDIVSRYVPLMVLAKYSVPYQSRSAWRTHSDDFLCRVLCCVRAFYWTELYRSYTTLRLIPNATQLLTISFCLSYVTVTQMMSDWFYLTRPLPSSECVCARLLFVQNQTQ